MKTLLSTEGCNLVGSWDRPQDAFLKFEEQLTIQTIQMRTSPWTLTIIYREMDEL